MYLSEIGCDNWRWMELCQGSFLVAKIGVHHVGSASTALVLKVSSYSVKYK
jgi:hypothetical protein